MPWNDAAALETRLRVALDSFDWPTGEVISHELLTRIRSSKELIPESTAKTVLYNLRRKQCFSLMAMLAEAMIKSGLQSPQIRRQYAQALIDQGNLEAPEPILQSIIQDSQGITGEEYEARGLLGRLFKQHYINNQDAQSPANRANLERALKEYLYVYRLSNNRVWHGINVVAISARASRDGFAPAGLPDTKAVAQEILATLEEKEKQATEPLPAYDLATRLEAYVALDRQMECMDTALRYVECGDADAFEINSTLRQLTEVWQLNESELPGSQLLPILKAGHLKKKGGVINQNLQQVRDESKKVNAALKDLQAVFGEDRMVTLKWYRKGLDQCNSVARIERLNGKGLGTGWLVNASDFFSDRAGLLLMTNGHVITDVLDPFENEYAITPDEANANFQALGSEHVYPLGDVVWTSPPEPDKFDATFVSIKGDPPAKPLTIHTKPVQMAQPTPRLYIIGHPGGRDLEISLQDNYLLACTDKFLHYRTPTEHGSSGSPVFEPDDWRVVALHHKGSSTMDRLDGQAGTYEANEGIAMLAIKKALKNP